MSREGQMALTDSMLRIVVIGAVFLTLWGGFMLLFVGQQSSEGCGDDIVCITRQSWAIFTSPELILINSIFGIVGIIALVFVVRGLLPA
jgi:hypothetical protein